MNIRQPYLSEEGAAQLVRVLKDFPLPDVVTDSEHIEWVEPKHWPHDCTRVDHFDGLSVVCSIYFWDFDGDTTALHDLGTALVYDSDAGYGAGTWDVRIPAYIDLVAVPQYVADQHKLVRKARDEALLEGRKAGQDAMKRAIRSLIGAASLVELEVE